MNVILIDSNIKGMVYIYLEVRMKNRMNNMKNKDKRKNR
jgi:hypothetical protein